mmetsp:Transcript_111955/g.311690  ORF Transcript_111955/g.311690 Transcript_111955/m.311690 type:complete len:634 (-) Transcript_111955:31-1932(-)
MPDGSFDGFCPLGRPCRIPEAERRGITLAQLLTVVQHLRRSCDDQGVLGTWEGRDAQGHPDGKPVKLQTLNLYHVNEHLIVPATAKWQCSFVELLATNVEDQSPEYFVSHWWGEPVVHFVMCLQEFGKARCLYRLVFWVCAYANNQHKLHADMSADPANSSFRRAMALSHGSVLVLDSQATPFKRVWCIFEIFTTLRERGKPLDIVTFVPEGKGMPEVHEGVLRLPGGRVKMITDGFLSEDKAIEGKTVQVGHIVRPAAPGDLKAQREAGFPLGVAFRGIETVVEEAAASVHADRVHILNAIAESPDLEADPPKEHPRYNAIDAAIRSRFAVAVIVQTVRQGSAEHVERCIKAICEDSLRTELNLHVPGSNFSDEMLAALADTLPAGMEVLSLGLGGTSVSDLGAVALGRMLRRLCMLTDFSMYVNNKVLTNAFASSIMEGMHPLSKLVSVTLFFTDTQVSDAGAMSVARGIAMLESLTKLRLGFSRTAISDAGVAHLAPVISRASLLNHLGLTFNTTMVGTPAGEALGQCIAGLQCVTDLWLGFHCSRVDDKGAMAVFLGASKLPHLAKVMIDFTDSKVRPPLCSVKSLAGLRQVVILELSEHGSIVPNPHDPGSCCCRRRRSAPVVPVDRS